MDQEDGLIEKIVDAIVDDHPEIVQAAEHCIGIFPSEISTEDALLAFLAALVKLELVILKRKEPNGHKRHSKSLS